MSKSVRMNDLVPRKSDGASRVWFRTYNKGGLRKWKCVGWLMNNDPKAKEVPELFAGTNEALDKLTVTK